jgi:branched-chain amino acid aminotransferase
MKIQKKYIWMDGKFLPFEKAKIHVLNHSLHYGSAVFEGIRCYKTQNGPAIFRLKDHIDRLFGSAETMGMNIPYSKKEIVLATKRLIGKNKLQECYIRPIVFYGEKMGLSPVGVPIHLVLAAWPWNKYLGHGKVSVHISKYIRIHPKSSVMTSKISGHYANSVVASLEAKKAGADEALLLDFEGNIAEGPGENIFFVNRGSLYTPKTGTILPGITRNSVLEIAKNFGYRIIERKIKPSEINKFEEAFFVGTAAEVSIIGKIGSHVFHKNSGVAQKIQEAYMDIVHGKVKKYFKWLDYVEK